MGQITRKIREFAKLPIGDRLLLPPVIAVRLGVAAGLRVLPFSAVYRLIRAQGGLVRPPVGPSTGREAPASEVEREWEERVARVVQLSDRAAPVGRCLERAMTACFVLRMVNIRSQIRIGVRIDDREGLMSHAWLERGGSVVLGGGVVSYIPLLAKQAP